MSGGDFESSINEYVTSVEQFVQTMHDGLLELTELAEREPAAVEAVPAAEPLLSQDLDAAAAVRLEEAERQVRERLGELEETHSELQAKSAELEEKSTALEEHLAQLHSKEEEIARLQARIAELAQERLDSIETPHDSDDLQEIVDLRNQVAELSALRLQVAELESLRQEAADLRCQAEQVADLQTRVTELQGRVSELGSARAEADRLRSETAQIPILQSRIASLEEQLARAQAAAHVRPLSSVAHVFGDGESDAEDAGEESVDLQADADTSTGAGSSSAPVRTRRATPKPAVKFTDTKKVLVVEGTEIHRVLFGRYFQGLPIEIRFARNETESERLQSESRFDLVITDWNAQLKQGLPKSELIGRVLARLEA